MNVSLQRLLFQLLILAVPLLAQGQTSILLETYESTPVEYFFTSQPMPPTTAVAPQHGSHTIQATGQNNTYQLVYTPDAGFFGQDFIRITRWTCPIPSACFHYLDLYITVIPAKVTARQDNASTTSGTAVNINVLANDFSSRGVLILNSIASVNNGTATFVPGSPIIQFVPAPGFSGITLLNYIVCDDENNCDNGTVSIHVTPPTPPAVDTIRVFAHKNTLQSLLIPPGFQRISGPSFGTYSDAGPELPEYMPNNNFHGSDAILFSNGNRQVLALITVLNTNFNQFAKDDIAYTTPGVAVEFNVLQNDAFGTAAINFTIVQPPANGTLALGPVNGQVVYTPNPGFTGTDNFKYSSRRPFGASNVEIATARVHVSNFEPAQATYRMATPRATPLVIGNNVPVPNFQFFITDQPDHGQVLLLPGQVDTVIYGRQITGYNMVIYVPMSTIAQGEDEFEIAYCVGTTANSSGNGCSFMRTVKIRIDILNIGTGSLPMCFGDCVWTGDTNFDGVVNMLDLLPIGYFMGEAGLPRPDANPNLWYAKYADNWDNPFVTYNVDLKHLDADGSGYVSALDTIAIHNFYGRSHGIVTQNFPASPYTINLVANSLFAGPGDLVELKMILGLPTQPALNIHGLTFGLDYNPSIFVPSSVQAIFSHRSWLAYNSPILFMNYNNLDGKLESGFTRTTGKPASGYGEIGVVRLIIRDDIIGIRMSEDQRSIEIGGGTSAMMQADGQMASVAIDKVSLQIRFPQGNEPLTEDLLKVWPNPTGDYINVHLNGGKVLGRIAIYNLMGQMVYNTGEMQARNAQIAVNQLPDGIYVLSVQTPEGVLNKKIEVLKR